VTAFDGSPVAVEKAKALAVERGQDLDFNVSGVEDWDWSPSYDAVVAIFVQFAAPNLRAKMFNWMGQSVVRGGLILLHGYVPRQISYGTGGPPTADNMYITDMLRTAFDGFEILRLVEYGAEIEEGRGIQENRR